MKFLLLCAAFFAPWAAAFSFNSYDLGFHGLYPRQHFHSVDLEPPAPKITKWDSRCDTGGSLLLTPRGPWVTGAARGPVILDPRGNLVWMGNGQFEQAMNLNVQKYKGQDYLTFWTKIKKSRNAKHSKKSYVMLDSSYQVAYKIKPHGSGLKADSHEFRITPQGTALVIIYHKRQTDCTELGLGKSCWIQDGVFQEIDIETGKLIFEWRATDHVRMNDVFSSPCRKDGYGTSKKDAFDFFHINSVDKMDNGDYIISARYLHAVACISGKTGEILWQLGGKNNKFQDLDTATDFAWQHHVTWQGNNTLSLFDNHANSVIHGPSQHSKGMIIRLDMDNMTASLIQKYVHPDKILNVSQGSVQIIPESGNVLVGFGNSPTYVEYTADGQVLCNMHYAPHIAFELVDFGLAKSYRVFKSPWVGRPKTVPDVKIKNGKAYVSWNGATEVTGWRLQTAKTLAATDNEFVTVQELQRDGFETSFSLDNTHDYVRIVALDAAKDAMASSVAVKTPGSRSVALRIFLILMLCFALLISTLAASLFFVRRFPAFRQLSKLSDFRARMYRATRRNREYDYETDPLLMNDRDD
ncbi:hypothetical protein B0A52_03300 [Exophiala mesophila]|uniref:ASST-domain-containing protein n=1 Tax=Exophiala mesophila TaxID=212818 RepID=A0A438NBD3_EXOME|nr:hypothetical protein B0A52_03300 [Exophiala mesophila]